nr:immunoglobulin heavy chain junction region [Macaca mulatta]MOX00041.1 immunoglobulin heavy chain junction region [Macaca mulatta]MOX01004.1 immunoglobulin heavy chain junction region [Macaca mulatta]MOX04905.1 immunoglobulin heavy chain junction region [Macaca mulatta]MOX05337.1 immunoglobulin heavy chain junction region [Macaca mulatta]
CAKSRYGSGFSPFDYW